MLGLAFEWSSRNPLSFCRSVIRKCNYQFLLAHISASKLFHNCDSWRCAGDNGIDGGVGLRQRIKKPCDLVAYKSDFVKQMLVFRDRNVRPVLSEAVLMVTFVHWRVADGHGHSE